MGKANKPRIRSPKSAPHWNKYGTPEMVTTNPQVYRGGQNNICLLVEQLGTKTKEGKK